MRKQLSLFSIILLCGFQLYAQEHVINGFVSGLDGNPVPSATVLNSRGGASTVTDDNGHFKISAPIGSRLTISSVGFESKEIEVKNQLALYITLAPNTKGLNDVVVTGLGIMRKEKDIGYSTTLVKGRDLVQARPISVANGLTGKVSGMQINTINNGVFAPTRIILRGNRSLTGNNQALIVVDGSIFYNDINNLNPDDIESINVLKGSSAAAIYGSDASNGVLLITTKKGNVGKPVINFSSTVQVETISYMPSLQNQFGSNGGESFPQNFNDLRYYIPDENQQFGPQYNGKLVPLGRPTGDGSLLMVPYSAIPGEKRNFFQNGITTQNNISYSA
ncbi:MAG TPA: TonB-dependent receptor plug domain-containing protein, partial [Puia sp.]